MAAQTDLAELHSRLRTLDATVAVAESLTGGLVTARLTETPGVSSTVRGGLVVYSTDLKTALAGVDETLLAERGAVDPQVALELARGARERLNASYGLGVTGVAGPEEQDGKPVGTVFAAVAGPLGERHRELRADGDRAAIREAAVQLCLELLSAECDRTIQALRSP